MQQVKKGDLVTIDYEGRLKNGETFETTTETGPLELEIGQNAVLPAFEQALLGMKTGETKLIEVPAENGFGPKLPELIQNFERKIFGAGINPQPGMVLGMTMEKDGSAQQVPGLVTEVSGNQVTIDFNHPLAGENLLFRITIKAVGGKTGLPENCIPVTGNSCRSSGCGSCN
jgi:peptidylprolyl isomerase